MLMIRRIALVLSLVALLGTPVVASAATSGQTRALQSAKQYLQYQAFSKAGLIDQLSSKYGAGFSKADATWAVNHCGANWYTQAVKSAKAYLKYQSFSRQGLIDQLSSKYGGQFTLAQATYAVNKVY
jgi:hypothetical protein